MDLVSSFHKKILDLFWKKAAKPFYTQNSWWSYLILETLKDDIGTCHLERGYSHWDKKLFEVPKGEIGTRTVYGGTINEFTCFRDHAIVLGSDWD